VCVCVGVCVCGCGCVCTEVQAWRASPLHFQEAEDKAPVQTKDSVLRTLEDLKELAGTSQGQRRAELFYKLVSVLRGLRNETLSTALPEMLDTSAVLTWQALLQCGSAECTSAILQALRAVGGRSLEMDALVYGLSLQGNIDARRVRDMLSMAKFRQSKAIMYALANTVRGYSTTSFFFLKSVQYNFNRLLHAVNCCTHTLTHTVSLSDKKNKYL